MNTIARETVRASSESPFRGRRLGLFDAPRTCCACRSARIEVACCRTCRPGIRPCRAWYRVSASRCRRLQSGGGPVRETGRWTLRCDRRECRRERSESVREPLRDDALRVEDTKPRTGRCRRDVPADGDQSERSGAVFNILAQRCCRASSVEGGRCEWHGNSWRFVIAAEVEPSGT